MIAFGDNVRVLQSPETDALRISGLTGMVLGVTTPSVTGVQVIGDTTGDCAFNVDLGVDRRNLWLAPALLEFVDHAPGSVAKIGRTEMIRDEQGNWLVTNKKRWWKLW
jgi:hypothetical protein